MIMNLRRIIREEMDDMDWIEDIDTPQVFVKIKKINESDDLQWIRDVRPIKYNIGDVIEPINGYFYYTQPWSEKYGPISGHINAKIIDIVDEFYEVVLNYHIYEDKAPTYYISIYDTDNKNLNESDDLQSDLQWIEDVNDNPLSMNDSWILINDVDHNDIGEGIKMQQFLFNKGYKWFSDEIMPSTTKQNIKSYKIYAITHIIKDVEGVVSHSLINYWPSSLRDVYPKDYLEDKQGSFKRDKIIYWSEIKG